MLRLFLTLTFTKQALILQPQLAEVGFAMMAYAARGATMMQTTRAWARELERLHARIAHRFRRAEPRRRSLAYLKALATSVERKNGWQMAEAVGDSTPDGMQRVLNQAEWDTDLVRDDLREYVVEHFADERAVLVVDETGFLKKGTKSVGVQPQYSGTAGKKENCQIGVFLCYASEKGAAFVDRALYLPKKSWANDAERRAEAGVPEEVEFSTKPELAREMLERAFEAEVPAAWVTGDTIYGGDRRLRMFLEQSARPFVLAIKRSEPLWADTDRGPGQVRADVLAERERASGNVSRREMEPKVPASTTGRSCRCSGCRLPKKRGASSTCCSCVAAWKTLKSSPTMWCSPGKGRLLKNWFASRAAAGGSRLAWSRPKVGSGWTSMR